MNKSDIEKIIVSQGWSFYGITDYATVQKKLQKHKEVFDEWVKKGFHAGMDYLPKMAEDRYDPRRKFSDVRSVVVLGAWYADSDGRPVGDPIGDRPSAGTQSVNKLINSPIGSPIGSSTGSPTGEVARYARGRDYHKVLKKKLVELSEFLKSQVSSLKCETFVSVDSGPVVDRVMAEAAGLGFFGNNSCLINPSRGSYFFIGSVLTNLELESTSKNRMPNCGTCTRCRDACPTGALKGGGVVDANRCISYLTIENKGPIPVELRKAVGNRLFGCDKCQEVCLYNQGRAKDQPILIDQLKPERGVGDCLDLRQILSIRFDEEFLKRFAGTALMRAKRLGLLRNACVVAGNSGDKSLISVLKKLIAETDDPMIREHAEWAIDSLKPCLPAGKRES